MLELKHARIVESVLGNNGGYRLLRAPSEIRLSEIVRIMDGPLAPFGDADQLRILIAGDAGTAHCTRCSWTCEIPRQEY